MQFYENCSDRFGLVKEVIDSAVKIYNSFPVFRRRPEFRLTFKNSYRILQKVTSDLCKFNM